MQLHSGRGGTGIADLGVDQEWRPPMGSGLREVRIAFLWAWAIAAPILLVGGWMVYTEWRDREGARLAAIEAAQAYERLAAAPPGPQLPLNETVRGRELFATVCVACHGPKGTGIEGLGRNLVESDFVASQTDEELRRFIASGRPNARPVAMPPKGGHEELTEEDLRRLVVYVRGLQDPRRMPELPAMVTETRPTEAQQAAALAAAGGDAELAGYIASGDRLFHSLCIACHGKAGVGIQGNGKALAKNAFIQSLDDDSLLAFVKQGRAPTDPKNTTGIQMPPKGGNPALSDDDILDIIAYLRTLQGNGPGTPQGK
jgi:mono/diheme cytochrome c family protein